MIESRREKHGVRELKEREARAATRARGRAARSRPASAMADPTGAEVSAGHRAGASSPAMKKNKGRWSRGATEFGPGCVGVAVEE